MHKQTTFIQKVPKWYVGDDCIQVSVPYYDGLTILNKDGICYHHLDQSTNYINKYLDDERRNQFPYSNIAFHTEIRYMRKYKYANQLFDYNCPYYMIGYGYGIGTEAYAIKDGNDAYFVRHILDGAIDYKNVSRSELEDMFNSKNDKNVYILFPFGGILLDIKYFLPSEEELKLSAKNKVIQYINGNVGIYDHAKEQEIIKLFESGSFEANIPLFSTPVVKVVLKNNDIEIKSIMVNYVNSNNYRVSYVNMPITNYNLNQIKNIGIKIKKYSEPKISRLLNPNISREDIVVAKNKVLELKK